MGADLGSSFKVTLSHPKYSQIRYFLDFNVQRTSAWLYLKEVVERSSWRAKREKFTLVDSTHRAEKDRIEESILSSSLTQILQLPCLFCPGGERCCPKQHPAEAHFMEIATIPEVWAPFGTRFYISKPRCTSFKLQAGEEEWIIFLIDTIRKRIYYCRQAGGYWSKPSSFCLDPLLEVFLADSSLQQHSLHSQAMACLFHKWDEVDIMSRIPPHLALEVEALFPRVALFNWCMLVWEEQGAELVPRFHLLGHHSCPPATSEEIRCNKQAEHQHSENPHSCLLSDTGTFFLHQHREWI